MTRISSRNQARRANRSTSWMASTSADRAAQASPSRRRSTRPPPLSPCFTLNVATRRAGISSGSLVEVAAALPPTLRLRAVPLPFQPFLLGGLGGLSGPAGPLHMERRRQPGAQALQRQFPVAELRALVRRHHPDLRPEPFQQAGPLSWSERGRSGDVEAHLRPGVGRVDVLAAGPAAGRESPVELVHPDDAGGRHAQDGRAANGFLIHRNDAIPAGRSAAPRS